MDDQDAQRELKQLRARVAQFEASALEHKRVVDALSKARDRAQLYLDIAGTIIVALDKKGKVTMINRKGCQILGHEESDIVGKLWFDNFIPASAREEVAAAFDKIAAGKLEQAQYYVNAVLTRTGVERTVAWHHSVLTDRKGKFVGTLSSGEDITERLKLEEAAVHSEKMKAIGRLSGGVAHDFNNILTGIKGHAELALLKLERSNTVGWTVRANLEEINLLADRAASLTRQLLAFGCRNPMAPVELNLNTFLEGSVKRIRSLIGPEIGLKFQPDIDLVNIKADPAQMEQIILNLASNAREAMPNGGELILSTANVHVSDGDSAVHPDLAKGEYVEFRVSDTGCGMDQETLDCLFEPFFSTKKEAQGTGLGLASVYGNVTQHDGRILVSSEPGVGTSFSIYLPAVEEQRIDPERLRQKDWPRGSEGILVVEDEKGVLNVIEDILNGLGYRVYAVSSPQRAEKLFQQKQNEIDLLLTDVVMPGCYGPELCKRLRVRAPDLKVLFISGYSDKAIDHHDGFEEDVPFMGKPFSGRELARKVREVLDQSASG